MVIEEHTQALTGFEPFEENDDRNARAPEHRNAAQDIRISIYYAFAHTMMIRLRS